MRYWYLQFINLLCYISGFFWLYAFPEYFIPYRTKSVAYQIREEEEALTKIYQKEAVKMNIDLDKTIADMKV